MAAPIPSITPLLWRAKKSSLIIGEYLHCMTETGNLMPFTRPDFTNTEPASNIGPFPQWADKKKIVSMDPLGHLAPWLFKAAIEQENGTFTIMF